LKAVDGSQRWRRLVDGLGRTGQPATESNDERLGRQVLVYGAVLMSCGGLLWGTLSLWFGLPGPSLAPFSYVVLTALNLRAMHLTRNVGRGRNIQVLLSLLLPFVFQASLGGFSRSGSVMLWAMIALVGSLTFSDASRSRQWMVLYALFTVASGMLEPWLGARAPFQPSSQQQTTFHVINLVTVSAIVFFLAFVLLQRQRRAIRDLEFRERENAELTEQLRRVLDERERDILRLQDAESALTTLAGTLEAQVEQRTGDLAIALAKAEAATRAKSNFLAVMSHEIRTPLNGILGTADILRQSALGHDEQGYVQLIRRSGDLLLTVLNDVLDFSKIEAGHLEFDPRVVDLREELAGVVEIHRAAAEQRGISVHLEIDASVPSALICDPDRVGQIIGNLMSNAVKFTHAGTVRLQVSAVPVGSRVRLDWVVQDSGIGIPADAVAGLFRPFSQADSSTTRKYGGTGLGLAICDRLVRALGGSITVESRVGEGTTFRLHMLVERADSGAALTLERLERTEPPLRSLHVLLAEDNPINQTIGQRLLSHLGCTSVVAVDGADAIRLVQTAAFDVILMDVQMPNIDGMTATKTIRQLTLDVQPPIVGVTANAYASDREACMEAGMTYFLPKPLRLEALKELLSEIAQSSGPASGGDVAAEEA
jgi:signal transduction histidine kinase/CheY-like chemotaxis protein